MITSFDARELEEAMISWLLDHHDDVVGFHGERGDMAEVAVLRDSWIRAAESAAAAARRAAAASSSTVLGIQVQPSTA